MTKERYEKIKDTVSYRTLMTGMEAFCSLTYVLAFILMIKMYTIIPFLLALGVFGYFAYKFYGNLTDYKKVVKYGKKNHFR